MWIKTSESKPIGPCIAFDAVGMSTGILDGSRFDSFQGGYSFDELRSSSVGSMNSTNSTGRCKKCSPFLKI